MGATILFCDIVDFSKNSTDEQGRLVQALTALVREQLGSTAHVIALPTGDGMALAFIEQGQSPALQVFALLVKLAEWSEAHPLRVGVHCGLVSIIQDVNNHPNVCGDTINVAQRVMSAAHPHQILFSEVAKDHYIGRGYDRHTKPPFSTHDPASFDGPFTVVAKHGLTLNAFVCWF